MADKKTVLDADSSDVVIAKAKDFWEKYNKAIMAVCGVIIIAISGFYIYKNYFKGPKEVKATDAMFKAEAYFRMDSINLALNGDGQNAGFLSIMRKYGGTDAANLAKFYVGACYIKLNENEKAIKYLKDFSTDSKPLQVRAYKLLGDAYGDMGKNDDALSYYKKAAHHFEEDKEASAEALFSAAYFADRVMKNSKEAIALYKELKEKFPNTQNQKAKEADKFLAQLGVYDTDK